MAVAMEVEDCGWQRLPLARERVSSDWPFGRRAHSRAAAKAKKSTGVKERRDSRWRDARSEMAGAEVWWVRAW